MVDLWLNRNVFVTGCSGFLGCWLVEALVERGAHVVGLVRDHPSDDNVNFHRVKSRMGIVWGDIEDYILLERALNEYEVDTVFHLAAQTIVGIANRSPLSTFSTNIGGTWKLLEACRRAPLVKRIALASSDKAYGNLVRNEPVGEDLPLTGEHPYDVSKSCADLIAQAYHRTYGLPVAVTRCGNFYGGGDLNWNRIVPGTVRSALAGEAPIIRSDGTYVRDYLYIRDAVACYMTLAEQADRPGVCGQAFNFSSEEPMSVLDMTRRILVACGQEHLKPQVLDLPEARHEIPYQALSSARSRSVLGWEPRWKVEDALSETVTWYRDVLKRPIGR